ncbi:MAG: helix-turn-helix domain-containing protein [Gemmataceae bacterium]
MELVPRPALWYDGGVEKTLSEVWVDLPENRAARYAIDCVLTCLGRRRARRAINPLYLHGPPGSGKSRLVGDLAAEFARRHPDAIVTLLSAGDLDGRDGELPDWKTAELILVEDVHRLPARAVETLVALVDRSVTRQQQLVVTAGVGPARLAARPARLISRLSQGLVVALEPLAPESRRAYLLARGAAVAPNLLDWLVRHSAGSARQLDGVLVRLHQVHQTLGREPTLAELGDLFHEEAEERRLTLDRIAQRVGRYYHVTPADLCSRGRSRQVLLPRQVVMYLARRLTPLSLEQIGEYLGGRDHSTVLHACRKVEDALQDNADLRGAVRELQAELT